MTSFYSSMTSLGMPERLASRLGKRCLVRQHPPYEPAGALRSISARKKKLPSVTTTSPGCTPPLPAPVKGDGVCSY